MTDLIRRFRGLGVALVVLALSAGAVFASAPPFAPSSHANPAAQPPSHLDEGQLPEDPTEAAETEDPTDAAETEAPEIPDVAEPTDQPEADATGAPQDTHGALVSAAAQMDTPAGFANHGAFVSCVAHMKDATLASIGDWSSVTPDTCAAAKASANGQAKSDAARAKGQEKAAAAKAKAQEKAAAARAKGAAGQSHP